MSERETAGTHPSPNFLEAAAKEVGHFAQDVGHAFTDNAKTAFDSHASAGARVEAGLHLVEAGATLIAGTGAITPVIALATPEAVIATSTVAAGAVIGKEVVHLAQDVGHVFTDNAKTLGDSHASAGARTEAVLDLVTAGSLVVAGTALVVFAAPGESVVAGVALAATEEGVAGAAVLEASAEGAVALAAPAEGAAASVTGTAAAPAEVEIDAELANKSGERAATQAVKKNIPKEILDHAREMLKSGWKSAQNLMHSVIGRGAEAVRAEHDIENDLKTMSDDHAKPIQRAEACGAFAVDTVGLLSATGEGVKVAAKGLGEQIMETAHPGHIAANLLTKPSEIIRATVKAADHTLGEIEAVNTRLHHALDKNLESASDTVKHLVHKAEYGIHLAAHFEHDKGLGQDAIDLAKNIREAPDAIHNALQNAQHKAEHKVAPFLENLALQGVQGFEHVAQKVADGANTAVHAAKSVESKLEFLKSLNENHLPSENHKQHNGVAHHMPGQAQHHNQGHAHGGR